MRYLDRLKTFISSENISILNLNLFVKFFCVAILSGHLLSYFDSTADLFSIFPGKLLPPSFSIWTLVTYSFIEHHIWLVVCNVVVVVMYAKVVEPLWGSLEILRFYAIVSLSVAVLTTTFYFALYFIRGDPDILFKNPIYGISGYAAGLTVVLKQVMGDQIFINSNMMKLRNKHIPLLAAGVMLVARVVHLVPPPHFVLFLFGLLTSWIYLRFYQRHKDGSKGDSANGFSFASFFPEPVNSYVAVISNSIFALLLRFKICQNATRKFEMKAPVVYLAGVESQDAERRRQLALKALNERLNKVTTAMPWPNMEEAANDVTSHADNDDNPAVFKPIDTSEAMVSDAVLIEIPADMSKSIQSL